MPDMNEGELHTLDYKKVAAKSMRDFAATGNLQDVWNFYRRKKSEDYFRRTLAAVPSE